MNWLFPTPTPRIVDTGSRYLKKNISLALIFRTLSSRVGEYFVHAVGFYLNLVIFATWKSFQHGLFNYIDIKAKCHNLKNWPVKGLCGRCLFVWGPPYTLYTYFILVHTGKGLRGGEELNQSEDRGSTVYKAGSKIPTYDWNVSPVYKLW